MRAAELNTSASLLVGEMLRESMRREGEYATGMRPYLERPAVPLSRPGTPYPRHDELHDRQGPPTSPEGAL